jgi:hypothetical protein
MAKQRIHFWGGPLDGQVWKLPNGENVFDITEIELKNGMRYEQMGFGNRIKRYDRLYTSQYLSFAR